MAGFALANGYLNAQFQVGYVLYMTFQLENTLYDACQKMNPSHIFSGFSISGKPFSIFFINSSFNTPNFIWSNIKCHYLYSPCTSDLNVAWISNLSFSSLKRDFLLLYFLPWMQLLNPYSMFHEQVYFSFLSY